MPKVNKLQASFNSGEISKLVYGRVDNDRYDTALAACLNYLPTIQGPLLRRPGTKFVSYCKDWTKIPTLIPFQFSVTQNYMLEFGDRYVRFFTNEGQAITNTTVYQVGGAYNLYTSSVGGVLYNFTATRFDGYARQGETVGTFNSSPLAVGAALELKSPYAWEDVAKIKFVQKQDTLYLAHPNYTPYKLARHGSQEWDFKPVAFTDGPYLPLNSYQSPGDSAYIVLNQGAGPVNIPGFDNSITPGFATGPVFTASTFTSANGLIRVTTRTNHSFASGNKVVVSGASGTIEANNIGTIGCPATFNSSVIVACSYWTVNVIDTLTFDLLGSTFTNAYTGSTANVYPALFMMNSTGSWADANRSLNVLRPIAFIQNGVRTWGNIQTIQNAAQASIVFMSPGVAFNIASSVLTWQLGEYNLINGFPEAVCFHQDRLIFGGAANTPQTIDGSMSGTYETFSASGSNLQVNNNNALQFSLLSQDLNSIRWLKSNAQGLLVGTQSSEWTITPSTQTPALTPTNIKADQVTYFGSYDVDATQAGNAVLYIQRAQRKIRELLYFWQVGSFRSTDLSELSEHLTIPALIKLATQKETMPIVWGLRVDGQLLSMSYSRDDVTLRAGWARHVLGGRSDSANSPPIVKSIATMPSSDTSFDELWMSVQRYTNGSTVGSIEYMTKVFDDSIPQEKAFHFDYGSTFDTPVTVTGITIASACVITAANHGFVASSTVRFYSTVGLNISTTDINGNVCLTNQLNGNTFLVASTSTNAFKITDFFGANINTNSSSTYVGSSVVRKLISNISGLGYLAGEQVSILADGGIHVNTSVTQAGTLHLQNPAAIVQIGYQYNSDAEMLRTKDGSAQGTSIGCTRRVNRVAFMLHNVGDFSFGPSFTNLIPAEFEFADVNKADIAPKLFDGIHREGIESSYGFTDTVCIRQNSGLPGMVQAVTRFLEEQDV